MTEKTKLALPFSEDKKLAPVVKKSLFSKLQNKDSVDKLVKTLSTRYEKRKGGYSRVIRSGFRYGDAAPMAVIELVDRDFQARRVDIKKKTEVQKNESQKPEIKDKEKAPKSKK